MRGTSVLKSVFPNAKWDKIWITNAQNEKMILQVLKGTIFLLNLVVLAFSYIAVHMTAEIQFVHTHSMFNSSILAVIPSSFPQTQKRDPKV